MFQKTGFILLCLTGGLIYVIFRLRKLESEMQALRNRLERFSLDDKQGQLLKIYKRLAEQTGAEGGQKEPTEEASEADLVKADLVDAAPVAAPASVAEEHKEQPSA
jgi:hypothetical protein